MKTNRHVHVLENKVDQVFWVILWQRTLHKLKDCTVDSGFNLSSRTSAQPLWETILLQETDKDPSPFPLEDDTLPERTAVSLDVRGQCTD